MLKEILLKIYSGKIYELPKHQIRCVLFLMAFFDHAFSVIWISIVVSKIEYKVPLAVAVNFIWESMHDSYYTLGTDTWRDVWTRRCEKLGSCLGAGASLWLFPHI